MASVPRQPQQRRASPSFTPSITQSIDSQTLLLNEPSASEAPQNSDRKQQTSEPPKDIAPHDTEPRKCWICFQDETEDSPDASPWRTPCPCALTAHEACLLDWIADIESPDATRSTAAPKEIKCPQCKSEIRLSRPRSLMVEATSKAEQLTGKLLLPGVALGLAYGLNIIMERHGRFTIRMIFGSQAAEAILAPSPYISNFEYLLLQYAPRISAPLVRNWRGGRVEFGLPLIPAALIASRTTLGDALLPVLPIVFFATHPQTSAELSNGLWPPSAALTLVVLPYVRGVYNEFMERIWGERERTWVKAVRPRHGEDGNPDAGQEVDGGHDDVEPGIHLEVAFESDSSGDESGSDDDSADGDDAARNEDVSEPFTNAEQAAERATSGPSRNEAASNEDADATSEAPRNIQRERELMREAEERVNNLAEQVHEAVDRQDHRQGNGHDHNHQHHQHEHRAHQIDLIASATRIAETSLGALAFPAVSAAMGQLLQWALPTALVVPQMHKRQIVPTGLLQTRWGRSIVGGCLFVVLKDAVRIYCRWKMAQTFKHRRVQDYNKVLAKFVSPT